MTSVEELLAALPIRDIKVRGGSYGNCGGVLLLTADLEAGRAEGVELAGDGAELPDWLADSPEEAAECMERVGAGAAAALRERFGTEPAVRIVVRRVRYNPVDVIAAIGPRAGRGVVAEAVGRARLTAGPVAAEPFDARPAGAGDWESRLRLRVGPTYAGTPLELDLKPVQDGGIGPHGLLVGTEGTGRLDAVHGIVSGFTRSHAPEQLNLSLLDAGDGAGFERFEGLPQVRAVIRGLAGSAERARRWEHASFTELEHRRELLAGNGFDSHAEYERARLAGRDLVPLPSLLVVVEGFGDVIDAASGTEFRASLIRIGRLGRATGVHMLLTASRLDAGVLRGLDGFLPYRIGMRTGTAAESRVVIGVNDAYDLPGEPGHAYLKAGTESSVRFRFGLRQVCGRDSRSSPPVDPAFDLGPPGAARGGRGRGQ